MDRAADDNAFTLLFIAMFFASFAYVMMHFA